MLESKFQRQVRKELSEMFQGCEILKNDSSFLPGVPDLLVLYKNRWAMLEVKRKVPKPSDYQPNQEWYLDYFNSMSYASVLHPENKEMVYNDLQYTFRTAR